MYLDEQVEMARRGLGMVWEGMLVVCKAIHSGVVETYYKYFGSRCEDPSENEIEEGGLDAVEGVDMLDSACDEEGEPALSSITDVDSDLVLEQLSANAPASPVLERSLERLNEN